MPKSTGSKSTPAAPSVAAVATSVLPMQDIAKLSIKEACQRFADRAVASQRAFAEMGKLHYAISAHLRKGQTIYGELRKLGVKDSTISNASYAARVWADCIAPGHLTEADYDTLTFADCLSICRAMGDKSKLKLAGAEVAAIVRAQPRDFDAELESIFATGLTVEEAEKQAAAETARKAREEAEAKRQAEEAEAQRVEAEKQAAIAAALAAQATLQTAQAAQQAAPPAAAAPGTSTTPAADGAPTASAPSGVSAPTVGDVPPPPAAAPERSPAPVPLSNAPALSVASAPSNVVPLPEPAEDPDAGLPDVLAGLDELASVVTGMSHAARAEVFAKLNEIMGAIGDTLTAEAQKAA